MGDEVEKLEAHEVQLLQEFYEGFGDSAIKNEFLPLIALLVVEDHPSCRQEGLPLDHRGDGRSHKEASVGFVRSIKKEIFGEMRLVKAKPARTIVKAFPVAALKQSV